MKQQKTFKKGLWVREKNRLIFVEFDEIAFFRYTDGLTELYLSGEQKRTLHKPLENIGRKVPSETFFQIHRNYIVNKKHIEYYESSNGLSVVLDGQELPVARRRKKDFDAFIQNGSD